MCIHYIYGAMRRSLEADSSILEEFEASFGGSVRASCPERRNLPWKA
jgi:hypothetical protein